MMIRTEYDQIVQVVASAMPNRCYVVNVSGYVPSADHACIAEVFCSVFSGCNAIVRSLEVGIFVAGYIFPVFLERSSKSISVGTSLAAKFRLVDSVGFDVKRFPAILANHFPVLASSQCRIALDGQRVGLIRAYSRAVVIAGFPLGGFPVKQLPALGALDFWQRFLLTLGGAFPRTKYSARLDCAGKAVNFYAADFARVFSHITSLRVCVS